MAQKPKKFSLRPDQIKPMVVGRGSCVATDMITVHRKRVGVMVRQEPLSPEDSGWIFSSGHESQGFMQDPANHEVFDLNVIANYDPDIIPHLDAPPGSAFERDLSTMKFDPVDFDPAEEA